MLLLRLLAAGGALPLSERIKAMDVVEEHSMPLSSLLNSWCRA